MGKKKKIPPKHLLNSHHAIADYRLFALNIDVCAFRKFFFLSKKKFWQKITENYIARNPNYKYTHGTQSVKIKYIFLKVG